MITFVNNVRCMVSADMGILATGAPLSQIQ
jgi:hypothetical protein